ncbi:MAG: efflux RND transporter permease subunit [Ruthenibacterium lactatiformans]
MADTVMERIAAVDVGAVGAMSGGSGMSSDGRPVLRRQHHVYLSDDRTATNADVSAAIEAQVADLDCTVEVQESTMDMSALGGSGVELVITGRGLDEMNAIADDLRGILRSTEGLVDISENSVTGNPETRITVDKYKAMQHGLTVAQIYSELAAELKAENTATTLTLDGTDTPVVVVKPAGQAPTRGNIMDHAFTVTNAEGEEETVRLYDIAAKQETDSVSSINRENGARTMSVSAGVDARHNIGLVSRELEKKLADYELPEGYTVEIAGENETINSAMTDLVKMIALAVVFIYLIMVAQFQSLMSPFIVMFTIPLAFTGGLLALWLTGSELSIIAMLGFLVLAGVVVNNGIVFVDNINQLRLAGMDRTEAILETGRTRIRPVLMTALTTILAMSTMALGIGDGGMTGHGHRYHRRPRTPVADAAGRAVLYDIFRKPLYDPERTLRRQTRRRELPQPAAGEEDRYGEKREETALYEAVFGCWPGRKNVQRNIAADRGGGRHRKERYMNISPRGRKSYQKRWPTAFARRTRSERVDKAEGFEQKLDTLLCFARDSVQAQASGMKVLFASARTLESPEAVCRHIGDAQVVEQLRAMIARIVESGVREGLLRQPPSEAYALMALAGAVFGYANLQHILPGQDDAALREDARQMVRRALS